MRKAMTILLVSLVSFVCLGSTVGADNKQVVGGAGPSTKVVDLFFSKFCLQPCAKGYEFIIPPISTKHAGGIANADAYLFGRTGRPLNEKERALNKKDIFLAKVPIAFASGENSSLSALSLAEIEKIFKGEINKWSELGGPDIEIVTVGREPTEALFLELKEEYPFFKEAKFDIVFKKDDEVVQFLKSPVGMYAIAFGAKPNFSDVKNIEIKDGFSAGVRLGLVYDQANESSPIVAAVKEYAASDEWRQLVAQADLIPVKK